MTVITTELPPALFGLPLNLIESADGTIPIFTKMASFGLNRETKREVIARCSRLPAFVQLGANKLTDGDERLLALYMDQPLRMAGFWSAVKCKGNSRGELMLRLHAPDLALLREYDASVHTYKFDENAFSQACPIWPQLATQLKNVLKKAKVKLDFDELMVWPRIIADLKRWNDISQPDRIKLVNAVFSMMSITGTQWFIGESIALCPELHPYFKPLFDLEAGHVDLTAESNDASAPLPSEPSADAPLDAEQRWGSALDRVLKVACALKEAPDNDLLAELAVLATQLADLAPQLGRKERLAEERYLCNRGVMTAALGEACERPGFEWFDQAIAEQLAARWNLARLACENAEALEALALDCLRAVDQGRPTIDAICANNNDLASIANEIATLGSQREALVPLSQKRALGQQIIELRARQAELDAALLLSQDRFLACLSPYQEPFDLDTDYVALAAPTAERSASVQGEPITFDVAPINEEATVSAAIPDVAPEPEADAGLLDVVVLADDALLPKAQLQAFEAAAIEAAAVIEAAAAPDIPATVLATASHFDGHACVETSSSVAQRGAENASTYAAETTPAEPRTLPANDVQAFTSFDTASADLCRPIWRALADGHLSLAFQLSLAVEESNPTPWCPSSSLLACVALADNVVLPEGAVVTMLSRHYQATLAMPIPSGAPDDWSAAIGVLRAAATLRPLLLAPASGAADMVPNLYLDGRHQSVYRLVRLIESHSERLQGFRLELSTFKGMRTEAAWQHEVDVLNGEARDWMEQAQHMTMLFTAATKVWSHWLKSGGLIHRLLSPVGTNDFSRLAELKALINELAQPGSLERHVQHTDRQEVGRRRGDAIHSRALLQITSRVEEAVGFARRWILLGESRPQASDALDRKLNTLRADIAEMRTLVAAELAGPVEREGAHLVGAARAVLQRSLQGLWDLFDPQRPTQSVEAGPEELLGRDLLLIPEVDQDEDWQPEQRGDALMNILRARVEHDMPSLEDAFHKRLGRDDMEGTERLLMVLERDTAPVARSLREAWDTHLHACRNALLRQINVTRGEADMAVAYGLTTEAERAAFEGVLVGMETSLSSVRRFWAARSTLDNLSATIAERRREKTDAVRTRLMSLAEGSTASEDVAAVEETLASGDILTANELLQRLERGERLERHAVHAQDRFITYFPQQANTIDGVLDELSPTDLRAKVRNAESFAGLDFSAIALPQVRQASEMVNAWLTTKSRRGADVETLQKLLQTFGFEVLSLAAVTQIGHRAEFDVRTVGIEDRTVCPIPYFGSQANGRYRLVCVWQRPAEEDIIKLVGDSSVHRATIVLYFGRLTERKRRDASRLAKLQNRSFLLIDETLLVSLTAEGGSRLAALFETALPFAYSAPYDATSSVVPGEMFFGRLQELQAIQGQNGRCFIYGGRQLGKTALLRKAEKTFHAPTQSRFAKWIDLRAEGIGVNRAPSEIWMCIGRELHSIGLLEANLPEPNPNIKGRVEQFIATLKEMLKPSSDRRVLLLLDEADRFFEQDRHADFAETRRLKELMEQTERRFKVVFAGLHNVLRMTENANHPLAHLGEPIKIGPLLEGQEWRDAEDLIRKPFAASGFEFESRDLVTRVLAQTNYYPSLIQLYCTHLLRQMLTALGNDPKLAGPRYMIRAQHVDAAYKTPALRNEIRTKFNLTLQLDPRYEVIAYTLAYGALAGRHPVPEGLLARDAKHEVDNWWPDGFANTSDLEFRVLLDEMVGLGVLRETGQGRYALRNPNVLLLLGNQEEIEDVLIKEREPAQEFDSSTFRARLPQEPSNFRRHPLTFQQLGALTRPVNAVTVLVGSRATGLDDVLPFLRATVGEKFLLPLDRATDRAGFKHELDRLKDRAESGTTVAVVPAELPWSYAWVADVQDRLARLSSKDKHAHILFLADPASAWSAIQSGEDSVSSEINRMHLSRWQDSFVRQWMEDCGLPNDQTLRNDVREATGYWPHLLYMAVRSGRHGTRVVERLDALRDGFADAAQRAQLLETFGLHLHDPHNVLVSLALLGEHVNEDELAQLADIDADLVSKVMRWASLMGLAAPADEGGWRLDPIAQRLLYPRQED